MALKKTDFTIQRGTEILEYKRGVKINDKATALVVTLVKNYKKGFFSIEVKWTADQITTTPMDDKATLKTLSELMLQASEDGAKWKNEWHENQPKEEETVDLFEGEQGESGEMTMGFKGN